MTTSLDIYLQAVSQLGTIDIGGGLATFGFLAVVLGALGALCLPWFDKIMEELSNTDAEAHFSYLLWEIEDDLCPVGVVPSYMDDWPEWGVDEAALQNLLEDWVEDTIKKPMAFALNTLYNTFTDHDDTFDDEELDDLWDRLAPAFEKSEHRITNFYSYMHPA